MLNISLFSKINQIVKPNKPILFNSDKINVFKYIKILNTGIYIINLSAQITKNSEIVLYKNNKIEIESLSSNIHHVIKLFKNDKISVLNNNKFSINCNNINLNIIKI
jgi:hypothetical protein